ncbi:Bgt-4752 [Blumeria graminis f. sp. tritici]|uniref:Bgt-4752 n=2 Tax=Blumeria graminis f. sp. tritici TaxID=62690 RepID=A0A061HMX1_BLUGR|nr:Plasma membrane ATP-binding cassette (ABC) transporter multidrug transporter [Blumeria graminis f. sp. tritici 96224]VCU39607.1 Bgt-4752 [Blumeria graminis f. sp. tritici]
MAASFGDHAQSPYLVTECRKILNDASLDSTEQDECIIVDNIRRNSPEPEREASITDPHPTLWTRSHSTAHSSVPTSAPQEISEKKKSWLMRLNLLRRGKIPAVPQEKAASREFTAGFFSLLYFQWMTPLIKENDLWSVNPQRATRLLTSKLELSFGKRVARGDKYPLLFALYETFRTEFLVGAICQLSASLIQATSPFILKYLIQFSQRTSDAQSNGNPAPSIGIGLGLVFGITLMQMVQSLQTNHFIYRGMTVGGEARAALISLIFEKAMKISPRAKAGGKSMESETHDKGAEETAENPKSPRDHGKERTNERHAWGNGKVMNLMSVDSYRVDQASVLFHLIWTAPIACILTLVFLVINLGYSAVAGFSLLIIGLPAMTEVVKCLLARRKRINRITDQRISLTQEILQAVRFVKLFSWECAFLNQLQRIRNREIHAIQILLSIRNALNTTSMSLPIFASMLAFITYSLTNHKLEPAKVFSSLALFNSLRMPLNLLPVVIGQTTDAWSSISRIQEYLLSEEMEKIAPIDVEADSAVEVINANFTWEKIYSEESKQADQHVIINKFERSSISSPRDAEDVSRNVEKKPFHNTTPEYGSTLVGDEGPFKLCDIDFTVGRNELVAVIGAVGSGKSSLLAALAGDMRQTRGNMRLGANRAFCPQYAWIQNATVRDNILPDLEMLPQGDRTEVGERGITVSGGQRQRINIARAIYFDAGLILMDDPLSAVDAHVGRHIFEVAILKLMKHKSRILVTHQLWALSKCDRVIWMEDGQIRAIDSFDNLIRENNGFHLLMDNASVGQEGKKSSNESTVGEDTQLTKKSNGMKLMQAEERSLDSVPWSVYYEYIRASGSIFNAPIALIFLIASQGSNIATSLWLSWWASDHLGYSKNIYIGVYVALGFTQAFLVFSFSLTLTLMGTVASKTMMSRAIVRTLRAPMSFFDTTPLGRITNRFSRDVDVMDNELPDSLRLYSLTLVMILTIFGLTIAYFHFFAVALVPLFLLLIFSSRYYRASSRELKRIEAVLRSHVFAKFSEGLSGIACIRAYGTQTQFFEGLQASIDNMNSAYYLTFANQRWLSTRLDIIGNFLILVAGALIVSSRFHIRPSIAGLILSYTLSIAQMIQFTIRQLAEVENGMNATERLHYYGTSLEEEAPLHTVTVRKTWPESGEIRFDNVQMRYRPHLPLILSGLSMCIRGGEHIGVVGRTGAGKSSIMITLFRLVELSAGRITIDGLDISSIGLHDLRSRLAIIPQDPTLFKGTIRSNLDPFGQHIDHKLWSALYQSALVAHLPGLEDRNTGRIHLDSLVEDEGLNFSLGQRQLMALARALVHDARIVICDEATSSVDIETDKKIQQTIATVFKGKTLLCIAHRLKTILNYDRICVLEHGSVAEFDTPRKLWKKGGIFKSLCDKSGIGEADFVMDEE